MLGEFIRHDAVSIAKLLGLALRDVALVDALAAVTAALVGKILAWLQQLVPATGGVDGRLARAGNVLLRAVRACDDEAEAGDALGLRIERGVHAWPPLITVDGVDVHLVLVVFDVSDADTVVKRVLLGLSDALHAPAHAGRHETLPLLLALRRLRQCGCDVLHVLLQYVLLCVPWRHHHVVLAAFDRSL